jgi:hypothetical protein
MSKIYSVKQNKLYSQMVSGRVFHEQCGVNAASYV